MRRGRRPSPGRATRGAPRPRRGRGRAPRRGTTSTVGGASCDVLVDLLEPDGDRVPGVLLDRESTGALAERGATRLILEERDERVGERAIVARRDELARTLGQDRAVPG